MLLEKVVFQILRQAFLDFIIKPHKKHYFFILSQNMQI